MNYLRNRLFLTLLTTLLLCLGLEGCGGLSGGSFRVLDKNSELRRFHIAVLPFDNLSGKALPVKEFRSLLTDRLREIGLSIMDDATLERFMAAHRLRYTGGLDTETAKSFKIETDVDAVLITTVELYNRAVPPKIALFCRLVSTGGSPQILWMDGVSFAGNQSPGILGLGLIEDIVKLRDKAFGQLVASLASYRPSDKWPAGKEIIPDASSGRSEWDFPTVSLTHTGLTRRLPTYSVKGSYGPRSVFSYPALRSGSRYSIAVVPFTNKSERSNAGELMTMHFVRQLINSGDFEVIDPGIVRRELINMRMVMPEGVSFADMDALFSLLNTDLVLIGDDFDYQDPQDPMGVPKVEFSTLLIERKSRKIIWSSENHNEGDNYIYAFDWGQVYTAHELMSRMVARTVRMMHDKIFIEESE
jgi:hypothetical protein